MPIGTVKFFITARGWGFIIPDDGGNDVFVRKSALTEAKLEQIETGQRLSYAVTQDERTGKSGRLTSSSKTLGGGNLHTARLQRGGEYRRESERI